MLPHAPLPVWAVRLGLGVFLALTAVGLSARAEPLPIDQLKAVKDATVLIRATFPSGQAVTGSGFFAYEPGLVVTNAHVLGMLDPDSRRPVKVEVVVRSGEPGTQVLPAEVLGVDRGTDLGVVRVRGKDLPPPLKAASAKDLIETAEVYAFGFPFGERLGKNITVAKTSVSSIRKTAKGAVDKIQVNGGIHPGNSGGPVVDDKGRVVGVAVSGLRNTQIHFAIPGDRLTQYLAGRVSASSRDLPYKDGDKVLQPVRVDTLDPLGRLQKVAIECFTGPAGPPRAAADAQPPPQPGDSPIKTFALNYDKRSGRATGDIELPPLPGPKHLSFARLVVTDGDGRTRWYGVTGDGPKYVLERVPQTLTYHPAAAPTPAEVISIGAFKLRAPDDDEFGLGLNLRARFLERAGTPAKAPFPATLRPTGFAFTVVKDGKPLKIDEDGKEILRDLQAFSADVVRDDDGTIVRARGNVTRVPPASREAASDLGAQLLQSLEAATIPLPNRDVKPLETWKSRREVVVGAASLSMTISGVADYQYTYLGMAERNGRKFAFVRVGGTIRGRVGTGVDIGGTVSGRGEIDPSTGETVYSEVTLKADADILTARRETLKVMGTMTVQSRRGDLPPVGPPKR